MRGKTEKPLALTNTRPGIRLYLLPPNFHYALFYLPLPTFRPNNKEYPPWTPTPISPN